MINSESYDEWTEYTSVEGWPYYYNNFTGVTTWDLPSHTESKIDSGSIFPDYNDEVLEDTASKMLVVETEDNFLKSSYELSTNYSELPDDPEGASINLKFPNEPYDILYLHEVGHTDATNSLTTMPPQRHTNSIFFNPKEVSSSIKDPVLFFENNFNSTKDIEEVELFFEKSGYSESDAFFLQPSQEEHSDTVVSGEDSEEPSQPEFYNQPAVSQGEEVGQFYAEGENMNKKMPAETATSHVSIHPCMNVCMCVYVFMYLRNMWMHLRMYV